MTEWGLLEQVNRFLDPVAVVFAITSCWLIKGWFFKDFATGKPLLIPGTLWSRIFPSLPIVLATLFVVVMGYKTTGIPTLVNKGVVSGAVAGYLNRTWKVTVRGE